MLIVSININLGFNAKPKFADRKFFADVNIILINIKYVNERLFYCYYNGDESLKPINWASKLITNR